MISSQKSEFLEDRSVGKIFLNIVQFQSAFIPREFIKEQLVIDDDYNE